MSSRSKRRKARNKRQARAAANPTQSFDPHAKAAMESVATMEQLLSTLSDATNPLSAIEEQFQTEIQALSHKIQRFEPVRLIEVARLAYLPFGPTVEPSNTAETVGARLELLSLIALSAESGKEPEACPTLDVKDQEMSRFMSDAKGDFDRLIQLAFLRSLAKIDPGDKLSMISLLIRESEVLIRNSSYPEMIQATNLALFDGDPLIRGTLKAELGFDATEALAVLNACDDLQQIALNERLDSMRSAAVDAMISSSLEGGRDSELTNRARSSFFSFFEPNSHDATVAIEDIAAHTKIPEEHVEAIVDRFRLDLDSATPTEIVDSFTAGKNPLRSQPLIVGTNGRAMLLHSAFNATAIRWTLEEHLKASGMWENYAKHRGELLESRTRAALNRILPMGEFRDAFEYYVPANDEEREAHNPSGYTKRVEGDHLVLVDDVAIIVEDKAVALSALARGGKAARIRTDLTGIITKAADQAGRMRELIEKDGGLHIETEGWVDLTHVREIHTIAVSLDDLSAVLTATAELMRADLLREDNIPWTVSLHDLELITELVDRPAEFLLYLRRRRHPDVTLKFHAPDELDLFLHFFNEGLWVEPDPIGVHNAFPKLGAPSSAEIRRYRSQHPVFLTSRTDALDAWFYSREYDGDNIERSPKPVMASSLLDPMVDSMQSRAKRGWLSIGATLLSCSTKAQHQFSRYPDTLLNNPLPGGRRRTLAIPLVSSADPKEGWIFVWATRPNGANPSLEETVVREYLRTKKHDFGLGRGAAFVYDQRTRQLVDVYYDGHVGQFDSQLQFSPGPLIPAAQVTKVAHSSGNRNQQGKQGHSKKSGQRKRRH